jgi:hypothetical protein
MMLAGLVGLIACTGSAPSVSQTPMLIEYAITLEKVNQNAFSVDIGEYSSTLRVTLPKDDSNFSVILKLLGDSTVQQVTPKHQSLIENGQPTTVTVGIPYAIGTIMSFHMRNGSDIIFNCTTEKIWFETNDAIYQASISPELRALLQKVQK